MISHHDIFEPTPRWPGAPLICLASNLPAFGTASGAADYRKRYCPSSSVLAEWQCRICQHWHFWANEPGDNNGGYRTGTKDIPKRIQELIRTTKL